MNEIVDTLVHPEGRFEISLAAEDKLELVRQMLMEAANWMQTNGVKQWNPDQFTAAEVKTYFDTREIYIWSLAGEPLGMFTLQDSDPDYWGALNQPGYSYLHRLTVRVPYRGKGLSGDMLRWAAKRSGALNRMGLRLDCLSQNHKLNALYQEFGFRQQGVGQKGDREFNLYELDLKHDQNNQKGSLMLGVYPRISGQNSCLEIRGRK